MRWRSLRDLESDAASPARNFDSIVMPHLNGAYNLARWLVGDATLAEEVTQDAMVRALSYFSSYRGGDSKAWLFRIVRNLAYSALAERRRGVMISLEEGDSAADGEAPAMQIADPSDSPEAALIRGQSLARLDQALSALSPELRECIVLHELEELPYRDVARITGVPIGTVMSRLWRARQALMRYEAQGARS